MLQSIKDALARPLIEFVFRQYLGHLFVLDSNKLQIHSDHVFFEELTINNNVLEPVCSEHGLDVVHASVHSLRIAFPWFSSSSTTSDEEAATLEIGTVKLRFQVSDHSEGEIKSPQQSILLSSILLADRFMHQGAGSLHRTFSAESTDKDTVTTLIEIIESLFTHLSFKVDTIQIDVGCQEHAFTLNLSDLRMSDLHQVSNTPYRPQHVIGKRFSCGFLSIISKEGIIILDAPRPTRSPHCAIYVDILLPSMAHPPSEQDLDPMSHMDMSMYYSIIEEQELPASLNEICAHIGPISVSLQEEENLPVVLDFLRDLKELKHRRYSITRPTGKRSDLSGRACFDSIQIELRGRGGASAYTLAIHHAQVQLTPSSFHLSINDAQLLEHTEAGYDALMFFCESLDDEKLYSRGMEDWRQARSMEAPVKTKSCRVDPPVLSMFVEGKEIAIEGRSCMISITPQTLQRIENLVQRIRPHPLFSPQNEAGRSRTSSGDSINQEFHSLCLRCRLDTVIGVYDMHHALLWTNIKNPTISLQLGVEGYSHHKMDLSLSIGELFLNVCLPHSDLASQLVHLRKRDASHLIMIDVSLKHAPSRDESTFTPPEDSFILRPDFLKASDCDWHDFCGDERVSSAEKPTDATKEKWILSSHLMITLEIPEITVLYSFAWLEHVVQVIDIIQRNRRSLPSSSKVSHQVALLANVGRLKVKEIIRNRFRIALNDWQLFCSFGRHSSPIWLSLGSATLRDSHLKLLSIKEMDAVVKADESLQCSVDIGRMQLDISKILNTVDFLRETFIPQDLDLDYGDGEPLAVKLQLQLKEAWINYVLMSQEQLRFILNDAKTMIQTCGGERFTMEGVLGCLSPLLSASEPLFGEENVDVFEVGDHVLALGALEGLVWSIANNTSEQGTKWLVDIQNHRCVLKMSRFVYESLLKELQSKCMSSSSAQKQQKKFSSPTLETSLSDSMLFEALRAATDVCSAGDSPPKCDLDMESLDANFSEVSLMTPREGEVQFRYPIVMVDDFFDTLTTPTSSELNANKRLARLKCHANMKLSIHLHNFDVAVQLHEHERDLLKRRFEMSVPSYVELRLECIDAMYLESRDGCELAQLGIKNVEVIDHIESSEWHKFLTFAKSVNGRPRESLSKMIEVSMCRQKGIRDIRIRAGILPLRMYVDQDALSFLVEFFERSSMNGPKSSKPSSVDDFVECFEMDSIYVQLDHKPKRMDFGKLSRGRWMELMNLFPMEEAELVLPRVRLNGVQSFAKIAEQLAAVYIDHVKKTQLLRLSAGLTGIRSVMNMAGGFVEAVRAPVEMYTQDRSVMRGVRQGMSVLVKTAAVEGLKVTSRVVKRGQMLLEHAEEYVSRDDEDAEGMWSPSLPFRHHSFEGESWSSRSASGSSHSSSRKQLVKATLRPVVGATQYVSRTLTMLRGRLSVDEGDKMRDKYREM